MFLPESEDVRFERRRVGKDQVASVRGQSSDVLGRERDEVLAGHGTRETNLRSELYADSVVDEDVSSGEFPMRDAS